MRMVGALALALLNGAAWASNAAWAQQAPYMFDVLQKPAYRTSWEKLIKAVQPTPDWLAQFSRNFDGVSGPMVSSTIDGKAYEMYFVCKPQDCASRKFEVLFEVTSKRAFGALGGGGAPPEFYGAPDPALQDALTKALKG